MLNLKSKTIIEEIRFLDFVKYGSSIKIFVYDKQK